MRQEPTPDADGLVGVNHGTINDSYFDYQASGRLSKSSEDYAQSTRRPHSLRRPTRTSMQLGT